MTIQSLERTNQCVVLIHGLARTSSSMLKLHRILKKAGYNVFSCNYPSTKKPIEVLSKTTIEQALAYCQQQKVSKIHFVTHSLGGILIRYYLEKQIETINISYLNEKLGRVVMLAPPNHGCEIVDRLRPYKLYKLYNGTAGSQLGTDVESIPNQLGPVFFDLGVIAGTKAIFPVISNWVPKPNDSLVSVGSTKVNGMRDFIVLPVSHTFIMNNPQVIEQTMYYLEHGYFNQSR